ncbi:MAG TPA: GFA family protein [Sphingomicrobium sp.]|nr:GFA family protein [Sphingomicrobium sp.]
MAGLTGGCLCGAVRYELKSDPFDCGWCHCRTCQLNSGAPAMAFASIERNDWIVTSGAGSIRTIRSSNFGQRSSCAECGTPLYVEVDHQPATTDFSIVTLDDPNLIAPEFHIFWSSKVEWFNPADSLPRHGKFRPDTPGLEGTDPPDDSSLSGGGR